MKENGPGLDCHSKVGGNHVTRLLSQLGNFWGCILFACHGALSLAEGAFSLSGMGDRL